MCGNEIITASFVLLTPCKCASTRAVFNQKTFDTDAFLFSECEHPPYTWSCPADRPSSPLTARCNPRRLRFHSLAPFCVFSEVMSLSWSARPAHTGDCLGDVPPSTALPHTRTRLCNTWCLFEGNWRRSAGTHYAFGPQYSYLIATQNMYVYIFKY